MKPVVILGGGISGLAAAYTLQQQGKQAVVFEAAPRAGGILDSFELEGAWRFDNGVHLSFAQEPEVRAVFDLTPSIEHQAKSLNWDQKLWLRQPVQTNLYPLPAEEKTELIMGLLERPELTADNYRDWLIAQYGVPIAQRWPMAYTRKYWTLDAEQLGTGWIGNRMRRTAIKEILFGAMSPDAPNTYYIQNMRYPVHGGYRAFIEPLIAQVDIRKDHRVVMLDVANKQVHFANGESVDYEQLISTIPLPALIQMMRDVPADIAQASATLFATQLDLISVGFSRPAVAPSLWFYIYDADILASRVYSPSWKSPNNAPEGCSSLQFEIYSSPHRPLQAGVDELKENCLYALEKMQLARRDEVVFMHHKTLPYANVVFDLGMEQRRDQVRDWVGSHNIVLAGRFGEWEYFWSNQSFMSGMRAAQGL